MKFSQRLPLSLEDNPLARALATRRAEGKPIRDLTLVNPTKAGLPYPHAEIAAALAAGARAVYEPDSLGLFSAREVVAESYNGRGPDKVDPARLCLTASTSEAYGLLFKLLGDAGAEVLAPSPSYPLIEHMAALEGWRTKSYPLRPEAGGWKLDFAAVTAAITPSTRAIVVVHPHNPTGWMVRSADAHFLLETCAERGVALIVDEVFLDYVSTENKKIAQSFAAHETTALTFTLNGLSKSCAMPQLKLGWIHIDGPDKLANEALQRLEFIADAYLSVGTPVQTALPQLLQIGTDVRREIQQRIANNCATLAELNWPTGFSVLPYSAGWSALVRRPMALDEEALVLNVLDRAGVLAHPGYFFDFEVGGPGYHVVSLLAEPKEFRAGVEALCEWLPKLV